jgi:hypothetical protein
MRTGRVGGRWCARLGFPIWVGGFVWGVWSWQSGTVGLRIEGTRACGWASCWCWIRGRRDRRLQCHGSSCLLFIRLLVWRVRRMANRPFRTLRTICVHRLQIGFQYTSLKCARFKLSILCKLLRRRASVSKAMSAVVKLENAQIECGFSIWLPQSRCVR